MEEYIGCDAHKRYSVFRSWGKRGRLEQPVRVDHDTEVMRGYLGTLPPGSQIAVETVGNWYWLISMMEEAGHRPKLAHAAKAKKMMGQINKGDSLDAGGLAGLLRAGTLPTVWIPPAELRDQRELPRGRMVLTGMRTKLKNRLHATLAKYNLQIEEASNIFVGKGRRMLLERLRQLPPETRHSAELELGLLDEIELRIAEAEKRIRTVVKETEEMQLLTTAPGIGPLLGIVVALEVGDVSRFPSPANLASYAGTVPRVISSGGKTYHGRVRPDVNRYLKWALVEAANVVVLNQATWADRHTVQLYRRVRERKGHAKAVVAVARHLAEATYWILKKREPYREPAAQKPVSSTQG